MRCRDLTGTLTGSSGADKLVVGTFGGKRPSLADNAGGIYAYS